MRDDELNGEFDDEELDDDEWDGELPMPFLGFESLLTRFLGYEVTVSGANPIAIQVVGPSNADSGAVLIGVYADCIVVQDRRRYTVYPQSSITVSVSADEWEDTEWMQDTE